MVKGGRVHYRACGCLLDGAGALTFMQQLYLEYV